MGLPNDRQFSGARRLPALAPVRLPATSVGLQQASARAHPQIERAINYLAFCSPGWCDQLRLLDSTPGPLRGLARDGSALRVRGDRSLRLLPLSRALLL